jgi:murein tripeptide amidase MpaA
MLVAGSAWAQEEQTRVRYDDYKVVRVFADSWDQIGQLHALGARLMSEAEGLGVVDYLVPPEALPGLESLGLTYSVLNDNIQKDIDAERALLDAEGPVAATDPNWFTNYKTLDQVNAKLTAMQVDRPDLVTPLDLGTTLEGRHIYGIRITGPGANKFAVQFNGCHHAREWISVMVPMWIADKLVYTYDSDPNIHSLVNRLEIFIIPVVNVDGYAYSWTTGNRLWRKNRRPPPSGCTCYGVDDNRNYSVGWGTGGASTYCCDEDYQGTAAFTELESQAMRNFTLAHANIVATESYHSYSQLIMSPWGYTSALPPDNATFIAMDQAMHDLVLAVHGVQYDYGPIYTTIYQASGSDVDWYYGHDPNLPIFSFTTELRDTGTYGFELPANQIVPTCEENFPAALYLADWSANPIKFSFPNGLPSRLDPNTPQNVQVKIVAIRGTIDTSSPRLFARLGIGGSFVPYVLTSLGSNMYQATLPATPCGQTLYYYFSAGTMTAVGFSPSDAPASPYSVVAAPIVLMLDTNMDTNPGWTTQGQWAWGQPTGGGSHNHDPLSGHTGNYVYGYNLAGDYANSIPVYYLTTPAISCTGVSGVQLKFWRWLGVESNSNYDKATVEVSGNNGTSWTVIWRASDAGAAVSDASWQLQTFDISAVADHSAQVRIRWGMGPTDGSLTYPGWNIDDVQVWAADPAGCPPSVCAGDVNCDGRVTFVDIDPFVEALAGESAWAHPGCPWLSADANGDGHVTFADIDPFVALIGTTCP